MEYGIKIFKIILLYTARTMIIQLMTVSFQTPSMLPVSIRSA
jgi:hypothetical protein